MLYFWKAGVIIISYHHIIFYIYICKLTERIVALLNAIFHLLDRVASEGQVETFEDNCGESCYWTPAFSSILPRPMRILFFGQLGRCLFEEIVATKSIFNPFNPDFPAAPAIRFKEKKEWSRSVTRRWNLGGDPGFFFIRRQILQHCLNISVTWAMLVAIFRQRRQIKLRWDQESDQTVMIFIGRFCRKRSSYWLHCTPFPRKKWLK